MKKTAVRLVSFLLLFLTITPVIYAVIKGWVIGEGGYTTGSVSYTLKYSYETSPVGENNYIEAYFEDYKTNKTYSFLQYAHRNRSKETWNNDYFYYCVDGIEYVFDFTDFDHPTVTFQMSNKTYTLAENGEYVILKSGSWPFVREEVVCPLPDGDSFYHPISITGMDDYAMIMTTPSDPDTVAVYIKGKDGWQQAEFVLPDGIRHSSLVGYIRRHFCIENSKSIVDSYIGDLEYCQPEEDGTATLYRVTYSEDGLILVPIKTYPYGVPVDWKF